MALSDSLVNARGAQSSRLAILLHYCTITVQQNLTILGYLWYYSPGFDTN